MSQTSQSESVIEVKTSFFFLSFLLMLFKPKASIDGGTPFPLSWGTTPVPVSPGRHQVEVWLPYLFLTKMGKNGAAVDVPAGSQVRVAWRAPLMVFLKGSVKVSDPQPLAAGAPGVAPSSVEG